jgi:hypothetical protein
MGRFLVPDVVGMPFDEARRIAEGRAVTLANPDPDGPPIASMAWDPEHERFADVVIERQDPAPGHLFTSPWSSVRVWLSSSRGDDGPASESEPRRPVPPPSRLSMHASPETSEEILDLTEPGN